MSELYENIKAWVLSLPEDIIVGTTTDSQTCIIATFLGKPLEPGYFSSAPFDVVDLSVEFDFLGKNVRADGLVSFPKIPIAAREARKLFCEMQTEPLTEEKSVVE